MKKSYRINVVEHDVPIADLPLGLEGLRLAHIGDLHIPKPLEFVQQVNSMLHQLQPELLISTGDLVDHAHWISAAKRQLPALLDGLKPPMGMYGTLGNHDRLAIAQLEQTLGMEILRNRCIEVRRGGESLTLCGLYSKHQAIPAAVQQVAPLLPGGQPAIVIAHYPSTIWHVPRDRVNLVLAGHTHAGQWRFGRLGCVWTHDDIPRHMAWGLHRVETTWLHVTAGLGESGPVPVRFNCPPEIAVLTLRRCKDGC